MKRITKKLLILTLGFVFVFGFSELSALPKITPKKDKDDQIQKPVSSAYDLQQNTVSNIQFYQTNYGIFGYNVQRGEGGGIWPRGSLNQYIFAGGVWLGCIKPHPQIPGEMRKYVSISYNPNSGRSWMVPGRIDEGDFIDQNDIYKHRIYFSTDFIPSTGSPRAANETEWPAWPIWDIEQDRQLMHDRYFGRYVLTPSERNLATHTKGPAFISGEDIFTTYKDTDLSRYEGGVANRRNQGYPLRLQYEQTIYSWGFGDYRDFIFIRYDIINYSQDTLWECWMAPVMDVDIARTYNSHRGAGNDRVRYYHEGDSLNLAFQWSNTDQGELGYGFGYLGFDFLESPAVIKVIDENGNEIITDSTGFVRRDKPFYTNDEQLGLVTCRNWPIEVDPQEDEERYNFVSARVKDGDTGPGDKRFLMATGPFNMRPKDTVRVVVGMILANKAIRNEPDGSTEDVQELIRKDMFAQSVYDNNFRAPRAPERSVLYWQGINNGMIVWWDSTAELSFDGLEGGLDFMGYRLYRARRTDLDTFYTDQVKTTPEHISGKGPFGWKQIGEWRIPTPFKKSVHRAGGNQDNIAYPFIDSLRIIGPYFDPKKGAIDTFAIQIMRLPQGAVLWPDTTIRNLVTSNPPIYNEIRNKIVPVLSMLDTGVIAEPWNKYLWDNGYVTREDFKQNRLQDTSRGFLFYGKDNKNYRIFDECMVGVARYTPSLVPFNPLFFDKFVIPCPYPKGFIDTIPDNGVIFRWVDGMVDSLDPVTHKPVIDPNTGEVIKVPGRIKTTKVDTVYYKDTYRTAKINNQNVNVIDVLLPINIDNCMNNVDRIRNANEFLYEQIKQGNVKIEFPRFEDLDDVRKKVIEPYMKRITNNRTIVDIGDDNRDNSIFTSPDPTKSERIVNNVDYYYKLLAFDEGDYSQPTPTKQNDASPGLPNLVRTIPGAAEVGKPSLFEITYVDSNKIGGLYNFQFWPIDQDRVNQNFAGHELELEFNPNWQLLDLLLPGRPEAARIYWGLYRSNMRLTSLTSGEVLFNANTQYEVTPCQWAYREAFTENAFSYVLSDTLIVDPISGRDITFGMPDNKETIIRSGKFSTGDFKTPGYCYTYGMSPKAMGTLGFSFDFTMKQFGGKYRPDTMFVISDNEVGTILGWRAPDKLLATVTIDTVILGQADFFRFYPQYRYASFNNGPGDYLVEFLPGGRETVELYWGYDSKNQSRDSSKTFELEYLTMRVNNLTSFKRPDPSGDSVVVRYPDEVKHMVLPYNGSKPLWEMPDPRNLKEQSNDFIGRFNLSAYGWVNARNVSIINALKQMASGADPELRKASKAFTGLQGKYYLTGTSTDGQDIIDFTHIVNVGGMGFALDKANKGKINTSANEWKYVSPWRDYDINKPDFMAGDKLVLRTFGGAFGLPMPGAKVRVRISSSIPEDGKYTESLLDQVKVVPNPYYISHEGQRSPYDGKVYFTKLPKQCTIDIYTINGQHVRKIEHNTANKKDEDKASVEVFDLISKYGQRVQSQTFIAVVTTPDGTQSTSKFTVVVGGFRLIQE